MKSILILFALCFSTAVFGKELPSWVEKSSKLQSYEQLVEWMKDSKFYRISRLETRETKIDSGQTAQETEIFFDDEAGCQERKLISTCIPLGLDTDQPVLLCQNLLTDCKGKSLIRSQKISK